MNNYPLHRADDDGEIKIIIIVILHQTHIQMYQQPANSYSCKLPNSNAISCIVDRDMTVENTIIRIKSTSKNEFYCWITNEDKISLSTVSRFGYSIPLGSNERIEIIFLTLMAKYLFQQQTRKATTTAITTTIK